jgi:hypothetical protein
MVIRVMGPGSYVCYGSSRVSCYVDGRSGYGFLRRWSFGLWVKEVMSWSFGLLVQVVTVVLGQAG